MVIFYQSFSSEANQRCEVPTGLKVSSLEKHGTLDARIANDGERDAGDTDIGLLDSDTRGCKKRGKTCRCAGSEQRCLQALAAYVTETALTPIKSLIENRIGLH